MALTYRFQGRDYRLTDIHGRVVKELLVVWEIEPGAMHSVDSGTRGGGVFSADTGKLWCVVYPAAQ